MKKILILLSALTLTSCNPYATLGGFSYHKEREYKGRAYNEQHNNIGFGVENYKGNHTYGTTAQYVRNSFGKPSVYVTGHYTYTTVKLGRFTNSTGITGGFATGYGNRYGRKAQDVIPVLGLLNEACYNKSCLYQTIFPAHDGMSGVLTVGFKYKF